MNITAKMRLLSLSIIISLCGGVKADLPIHAVMSDVLGTWLIKETKILKDRPTACGSGAPNSNIENLQQASDTPTWLSSNSDGTSEYEYSISNSLVSRNGNPYPRNEWKYLSISSPSKPSVPIGTWSMVYDEGFEMRVGSKRYFGFLDYSRKDAKDCPQLMDGDNENDRGETKCYVTNPAKIRIGWVSQEIVENGTLGHKWGCFWAQKKGDSARRPAVVLHNKQFGLPTLPSSQFIDKQNSSEAWTAREHDQFKEKTPRELALHIGESGFRKFHPLLDYKLPSFLQRDRQFSSFFACPMKPQSSGSSLLPKFWSWGDASQSYSLLDRDIINQGNCGSCYAVSAAYVLQKRFEILLGKLFPKAKAPFFEQPLSPQSIISCSPYNQGCDGGFPFLVGKHSKEFGLGTTACQSYLASHDPNEAPCFMNIGDVKRTPVKSIQACSPNERWYAKDYDYVGGFYESCNEEKMMKEIYHHGPVVVALDAPESLFIYEEGLFDSKPGDHGRICDVKNKGFNGWEFTNHAVAVVGWGEERTNIEGEPQKYWIVRNTWGPSWGQHGYMKMKRGENLAGIEGQAVLIDPDISRGKAAQLVTALRRQQRESH